MNTVMPDYKIHHENLSHLLVFGSKKELSLLFLKLISHITK